jgi:hypothetical protein
VTRVNSQADRGASAVIALNIRPLVDHDHRSGRTSSAPARGSAGKGRSGVRATCEACHVGAFGPQLKPYGRDFKLFGYQNTDKMNHSPPLAVSVLTSFTHTDADQTPAPAPHFGPNDNATVDQVSVFYAGRAPMGFGVCSIHPRMRMLVDVK